MKDSSHMKQTLLRTLTGFTLEVGKLLKVFFRDPGIEKQKIPVSALWCKEE